MQTKRTSWERGKKRAQHGIALATCVTDAHLSQTLPHHYTHTTRTSAPYSSHYALWDHLQYWKATAVFQVQLLFWWTLWQCLTLCKKQPLFFVFSRQFTFLDCWTSRARCPIMLVTAVKIKSKKKNHAAAHSLQLKGRLHNLRLHTRFYLHIVIWTVRSQDSALRSVLSSWSGPNYTFEIKTWCSNKDEIMIQHLYYNLKVYCNSC